MVRVAFALAALSLIPLTSPTAYGAVIWYEYANSTTNNNLNNDAGDGTGSPRLFQNTTIVSGLVTQIVGSLDDVNASDAVDMFEVKIGNPADLTITMDGTSLSSGNGSPDEPFSLYIFDGAFNLLAQKPIGLSSPYQQFDSVELQTLLAADTSYFFAYASFYWDPYDSSNAKLDPMGPVGPLASWTPGFSKPDLDFQLQGNVVLNFNYASGGGGGGAVPEPASLALFGGLVGGAALMFARRRKVTAT